MNESIEDRIGKWNLATFNEDTDVIMLLKQALKCQAEAIEVIETDYYLTQGLRQELADVIIAAIGLSYRAKQMLGNNWEAEVEKKFEIVKNRNQKAREGRD